MVNIWIKWNTTRIFVSFKEALHERSPEMVNIYDDIQPWYSEKIKPQDREEQGLEILDDLW